MEGKTSNGHTNCNRQVSFAETVNSHSDLKTLEEQLDVVEKAVDTFFQNKFRAANELFSKDPNLDSYIYCKHGRACLGFVIAVMTMEEPEVKEAFRRVQAVLTHV